MNHFVIISASVRIGRLSHRAALYFKKYLENNQLATVEILDLAQYQFPVFNERLKFQTSPADNVLEFANKIKHADGAIIITPEYNGGCPASLKNIVDLLYDEWYHKPIAISTVSNGVFGGSQVITSLQFSLWKIKALTVPATFPIPKIQETLDEQGNPIDKTATDKRAASFIKELLWLTEAARRMNK